MLQNEKPRQCLGEDLQVGDLEVLLEGARAYQLAAYGFMYPDKNWLTAISSFLSARKEGQNQVPEFESSVKKALDRSLETNTLAGMAEEYDRLFGVGESILIPMYETEYAMDTIFAKTKELADLNGFYNAFGVELGRDSQGERPDHISIELDFTATLMVKEAYARNEAWEDKAGVCLESRKKFLKDHIGRWGPTFCSVVKHKTEVEFYKVLASSSLELINKDLRDLNIKPGFIEPFEQIMKHIESQSPNQDPNECPIEH
jgi:TorA maturation chaperone TorD